jgi:AcrR family transcriptional regulator
MAKKAQTDIEKEIVEAAMAAFAAEGYAGARLTHIAEAAGIDLGALRARVSDKAGIVALALRRIDGDVLGEDPGFGHDESVRDRLFDLLMRRFDALSPYRPGLKACATAFRADPALALRLAPAACGGLGWYLEAAGTSADGPMGALRLKGLSAVWLRCLSAWFDDEGPDLPKTMAALDKALAQAERVAQWTEAGPGRKRTKPEPEDTAAAGPEPDA